ncbi:MAG: cellulase family glycosylhydrolase [Candidatus Aureabacteria bacterium]|nr:cellulase family glycosylhydrolase [Candidatus Auribacterota bacterium]
MPEIKVKNVFLLLLVISLLPCYYALAEEEVDFGLSFPPIKNAKEIQFTIQEMKSLNISLVRISTDWKFREPEKEIFNWPPLDQRINSLYTNHISILLTITAVAPDWACTDRTSHGTGVFTNARDFRKYVQALLKRYKDKIDKIQFANEWDNPEWYPGTEKEYVQFNNILYDEVKNISPKIKVILGGLTRLYPVYMSRCVNKYPLSFKEMSLKPGIDLYERCDRICTKQFLKTRVEYVLKNAKYDMIDLHLYDDAENWKFYVKTITSIITKPVLVSEFGGPSSQFEIYSEEYHANRMLKYIDAIKTLPIMEAYYFNLIDNPQTYHENSGLMKANLDKKKAYYIFKNVTTGVQGRSSSKSLIEKG